MWVIAHRGGGDLFPENTLKAFQQSESLGVDMVECDVHVSLDGQLMVIHDATLERTGGKAEKVQDLTAEELAHVDVGEGQGVPTLRQLLDAIHIPVVVEIKTPDVVQGLIHLLKENPALTQRIIPISFFHQAILSLQEHIPDLYGGILLMGAPVDLPHMARAANVRLVSLYYELVTAELVDAMHQEDMLVSVWTPNSKEAIQHMLNIGVDGIASDRPDWVIALSNGSAQ